MNHNWEEKDIHRAIKRLQKYRDCGHGLVVTHIKSGNIPAQDWRNLMVKLVELGHAFDNGESQETDKYQISINWEKQAEIFPKPFFPPALLCHPEIIDLPPRATFGEFRPDVERLLGRQLTLLDWTIWVEAKSDWSAVYEVLCCFQTTGKFKVGTYGESLKLVKEKKKHLLLLANEVACMYKAIETACVYKCIKVEDSEKPDEVEATELFLDLLTDKSWTDFIVRCLHPGSSNPRSEPDNIRTIIQSHQKLEELLKQYELFSSKPVPDDEKELKEYRHEWAVFRYEFKEAHKDFWNSLLLFKKNLPPHLLDFAAERVSEPAPQSVFINQLLSSSIPEVVEKAQLWADANHDDEYLKITQGFIRRLADQRRSDKQK